MRTSRSLAAVGATLSAVLALVACSSPADVDTTPSAEGGGEAETQGTGTLNFAIGGDPMSLNPINVSDRWGLTTTNLVYSPLARIEPDGSLTPELAESIETAPDGLSVTVTLREDVLWSDGEPLTADDVVFTYTEKAKVENGNADSLLVGGEPITATAVDEHTVRFDLPGISAAAANNLATETYILPEHVYGELDDLSVTELDPIAVGTGPYALAEYRPGELLRLEANESYYGGAPQIANLNLRIVTNADTIKAALQTGEIDGAAVLPAELGDLEGAPVEPYVYSEGRVAYLGAIETKPVLEVVRVRQALFFGIDREELNVAAYLSEDYFDSAATILPPSNPYFSTDGVETYEQDRDQAETLLTEAGVSGLEVTLAYTSTDPAQAVQATLIQQQLSQIGVTVRLSGLDSSALYAELDNPAEASFDLFLGGYIMGNDPDFYGALFRTGASANYFDYSNPDTDALFDAGAATLDDSERQAIYLDLQRQIAEDAVFFPIVDNNRILVFNERIGGVEDSTPVAIYSLEHWELLTEQ
ncbi:ABC transporter substrate-binding protein [Pseudactinotalea sp.]|uniref:ABC transporter substrate-binding protein n=1 Tax=Pseudactinotalea sp. TaxID=1926260 RepID=UPI003B3A7B81